MNEIENAHIVTAFDQDLENLERHITEMGGIVEFQIENSIKALKEKDIALSEKVIVVDRKVDQIEDDLDTDVVRVLALRQPQAQDLRSTVCVLRIAANLERIGDYAKNIAKRNRVLVKSELSPASMGTIMRMGDMVNKMINEVIDAYLNRETEKAEGVRMKDDDVDQLYNTLFRELLTYMMENPKLITSCMHLLFVAKNLERIGDHATSIAEQVIYLVTGEKPDDSRPKSDNTSYLNVEPSE